MEDKIRANANKKSYWIFQRWKFYLFVTECNFNVNYFGEALAFAFNVAVVISSQVFKNCFQIVKKKKSFQLRNFRFNYFRWDNVLVSFKVKTSVCIARAYFRKAGHAFSMNKKGQFLVNLGQFEMNPH